MAVREEIALIIEQTPGLKKTNVFEIIGRLSVISSKPTIRSKVNVITNPDEIFVHGFMYKPENSPEGAHYWRAIHAIVRICRDCEHRKECLGNTITIKRNGRIKCVILNK